MSYEGRVQFLCEKGHQEIYDALSVCSYYIDGLPKCSFCNSAFVWAYDVDDTNCDGELAELILLKERQIEICNHCNSQKIVEPCVYEIPKDIGRKP